MAAAKAKGSRKAGAKEPAGEAWDLLSSLVYPPPFLPIVRELNLRPASFGALRLLAKPCTMSEIAEGLHCDRSNVTGIVDSLEERGLARRVPSERDRRVKLIELTSDGRRLHARLMRAVSEPPAWLADMSAGDQRALRDLLRRISAEG